MGSTNVEETTARTDTTNGTNLEGALAGNVATNATNLGGAPSRNATTNGTGLEGSPEGNVVSNDTNLEGAPAGNVATNNTKSEEILAGNVATNDTKSEEMPAENVATDATDLEEEPTEKVATDDTNSEEAPAANVQMNGSNSEKAASESDLVNDTDSVEPITPHVQQNECIKLESWGGGGGQKWETEKISASTQIKRIIIKSGDAIDSIEFIYKIDGEEKSSGVKGGRLGTPKEFILNEGEEIGTIEGSYAQGWVNGPVMITWLKFIVGRTGRESPSFGSRRGKDFKITAANGKIVGFHGRAGSYVDAIGVYIEPKYRNTLHAEIHKRKSIRLSQWGGGDGVAWGDEPIDPSTRVTKIIIRHGDFIDSFKYEYKVEGSETETETEGGDGEGGEETAVFTSLQEKTYNQMISLKENIIVKMLCIYKQLSVFFCFIRHGDFIDSFKYEYKVERSETETETEEGDGEGGEETAIVLHPCEYITGIRGSYGDLWDDPYHVNKPPKVIHRLTFYTNQSRRFGPFGLKRGKHFSFSAQDGKIVGFHGVSGKYLEGLGVYLAAAN